MKSSVKIPTESLLKSKALAGYQIDFARAILTESEYTVDEAKAALDKVLKPVDEKTKKKKGE